MENLFFVAFVDLLSLFVGFAVGRLGDKWGGKLKTPHHWIYGLVLVVLGVIYFDFFLGIVACFFGIGHFVSDLDDFLNMRIFGTDIPHKWKFWSIK